MSLGTMVGGAEHLKFLRHSANPSAVHALQQSWCEGLRTLQARGSTEQML